MRVVLEDYYLLFYFLGSVLDGCSRFLVHWEINDGRLLPHLQPDISGYPTVVLIHSPIALSPVVELTASHAQPGGESSDADLLFSDQRRTNSTT